MACHNIVYRPTHLPPPVPLKGEAPPRALAAMPPTARPTLILHLAPCVFPLRSAVGYALIFGGLHQRRKRQAPPGR